MSKLRPREQSLSRWDLNLDPFLSKAFPHTQCLKG